MNESYFLDTSFIISYIVEEDNQHNKTRNLEHYLTEKCYLNNNVLSEVVTVLYNKTKDLKLTNIVYFSLKDDFNVINEYTNNNYNNETLKIFNNHAGKLSFVDAGIIATMKENNIRNLLTFDKQFTKEKQINVIN